MDREDKMEIILDYFQEGWYQEDPVDELRALHMWHEKPLHKWSDDEIDNEYEMAKDYLKDIDD